mmetsp:Transcript_18204/g.25216  ORF Transcript_18204/g.25216 Transcript_18204/m.25216 type:complete len:98 (-) Transcript_18204:122-415(-)
MQAANWSKLAPRLEVYPLIAAMCTGSVLCVGMMGRTLVQGCDVRIQKDDRQLGVMEDEKFSKEGDKYYNSPWRSYFRNCQKEIFGRVNDSLGGGKYH